MAKQEERWMDRRIVERNIEKGIVSRQAHTDYIKGLPDSEASADWVPIPTSQESDSNEPA